VKEKKMSLTGKSVDAWLTIEEEEEKEKKRKQKTKPEFSGSIANCKKCPNPKCGKYVPRNVLEKFSKKPFCSVCLKEM
jgi:aspartate carbamoyltransferase regulatory subunit